MDKVVLLSKILTELGFEKEIICKEFIDTIDKGINKFMQNTYFAQNYESIPTDRLKCHELLTWAHSVDCSKSVVSDLQAAVRKAFDVDEWQWLIDNTPNVTAKICWSKILKAKRLEVDFIENENTQYYYMDDINRVGKEEHYTNADGVECIWYYLYEVGKGWIEDSCEITDHQMGYDPTEDDFYKFGNTEIMAALHEISAAEAVELLKKNI